MGKTLEMWFADKLTTLMETNGKVSTFADGQDGLYNKDKAKAQLEKAKSELQKMAFNSQFLIDVPVAQNSTNFVSRMQSLKQTVEKILLVKTMSFLTFK